MLALGLSLPRDEEGGGKIDDTSRNNANNAKARRRLSHNGSESATSRKATLCQHVDSCTVKGTEENQTYQIEEHTTQASDKETVLAQNYGRARTISIARYQ